MNGIFKENTSAKTCIGLSVLLSSFAKMCFAETLITMFLFLSTAKLYVLPKGLLVLLIPESCDNLTERNQPTYNCQLIISYLLSGKALSGTGK